MRAIRLQKHHRKHSGPCQMFPFFVKLQSHKCWKHCSYWVLSEVPIFQRDPPVPIEIRGAACGKSVGMLVWIRCVFSEKCFFRCSSRDRELYLSGTCRETGAGARCGRAALPWALGWWWSAKAPGVMQGALAGLSTAGSQPGNHCLQLGAAVGEKGMNNLLVSTAPRYHYPASPSAPSDLLHTALNLLD